MDLYLLLPLITCIGASAITSVILARDPSARRSWIAAAIVACAALWGLCDLMAQVLASQAIALQLARVSLLPILVLPPLALQLLLEDNDDLRRRYRALLILSWIAAAVMAPVGLFTPGLIAGVVWTHFGWMNQFGPLLVLVAIPVGESLLCGLLFFSTRDVTRDNSALKLSRVERGDGSALALAATLPLCLVPLTEVVAPLLEIAAPRLGALTVAIVAALLWILSVTFGEHAPPPSSLAREILDTLSDGVALINRDGRICAANATLAELASTSHDDLAGRLFEKRLGISLAELPDEGDELETTMRRDDGTTIAVSVARSNLRDSRGSRLGSVCVVRDFREVVRLRHQLVAAGRLAAVGELAAGVVHEVNNPIAFIQSNLHSLYRNDARIMEIVHRELAPNKAPAVLLDGHHLIGQSLQGIARVATIVKEVRGFSHMGSTGRQMNDFNAMIEDVVRVALPQLRNRATLVQNFADLPLVECVGQDIRQVLLDLILNAVSSLDGTGTIRLTTHAARDTVTLVVEDEGRGYTPDQIERIFDPMAGRGAADSGPDLCVAYQIVRQHGGEIHLSSVLGEGTRVSVQLPTVASFPGLEADDGDVTPDEIDREAPSAGEIS